MIRFTEQVTGERRGIEHSTLTHICCMHKNPFLATLDIRVVQYKLIVSRTINMEKTLIPAICSRTLILKPFLLPKDLWPDDTRGCTYVLGKGGQSSTPPPRHIPVVAESITVAHIRKMVIGDDSGSFDQLLQIRTNGNKINTFAPEYIKLPIT